MEQEFFVTGGTLGQNAQSYVARAADADLLASLRQGEFCYVLTSRQMGKSSLMVRTATRLREGGAMVVVLDLTRIGQNIEVDQWYFSMLMHMGEQLRLEEEMEAYWDTHEKEAPLQRFMGAIREVYLERKRKPMVIFVDEIDYIRSLQKFSADELLAGIRECYNRRTRDPKLHRLTFCLLGVATPSDLIRDQRMTPFNIGRGIELHDFTLPEAAVLADGLSPHRETAHILLQRIYHWTSGHPYLTQKLSAEVAKAAAHTTAAVDRVCEATYLSVQARQNDDNLHFVRERLLQSTIDRAALLDCYAKVCRGEQVADDHVNPVIGELRLAGIVRAVGGFLKIRNQIYAGVFDLRWTRNNLPDAEQRRQKAAFRRGVQRVAGLSAAVLLVLGIIVFIAIGAIKRERQALQRERELAAFAKTAAFEAGQSADEAKAAAARVVEANRDRLAQAARTEVALREKEQALQSSKAVLAMLSANQATTERLLEKLTPFIGEGSEALLTLAEELTQSISAAASLDPEIRLGQAGLHAVCSKLYLKLGKSEKALAQALEARRMVEELISRDPDSQTLKLRLFDFHLIVSEAFLRTRPQERPSTAAEQQRLMEPCETAVAVARTEALKVPSAGPWRSRYLTALSKTGQYLALFDRPQEAVERFQQAELFLSEHLKKTPDDRGLKQMLALLKDRLGNLFLSTGRISEAMEQFETALKIRKQGSGPTLSEDPEAQSDLATSYNKIGNVFLTQGDWEKALVYQQQSLGMREALCKQEPNPERMRDLGYTLNNVGKALWKLKRDDQAIGLFRKRYELMGKLMEEDSSDQSLRDYSNAVYAYADMLLNTRDAGLQDKPLSLELAAKAVKLNQRKEPRYLALLAQSQRLNGQTREARATAEEAFKLLPAEDNGSSELQETAREIAFELKRSKSPAADGTAAARTPKKKRR